MCDGTVLIPSLFTIVSTVGGSAFMFSRDDLSVLSRRKFLQVATASAGAIVVGDLVHPMATAKAEGSFALIRGVNFYGQGAGSLSTDFYTELALLEAAQITHANWVVFNPFWVYLNGADPLGGSSEAIEVGWPSNTPLLSTLPYETTDARHGKFGVGGYESYRDSELEGAITFAKRLGLKVMLKPMIDPFDPQGPSDWRGSLDPGIGNIAAFMEAYARFITHYAAMAEAYDVDLFCIGCELNNLLYGPYPPPGNGTSGEYTAYWTDKSSGIVAQIRAIYSGPLTYAGYQGEPRSLWAELDYIGQEFYPTMIANPASGTSDVAALQAALINGTYDHYNNMANMAALSAANDNKQIIFTEFGFQNRPGAAYNGTNDNAGQAPYEQAAAVQAVIQEVEGGGYSWYAGMFIWDFWDLNVAFQPNSANAFEMYKNYADRPVLETLWEAPAAAPYSPILIHLS